MDIKTILSSGLLRLLVLVVLNYPATAKGEPWMASACNELCGGADNYEEPISTVDSFDNLKPPDIGMNVYNLGKPWWYFLPRPGKPKPVVLDERVALGGSLISWGRPKPQPRPSDGRQSGLRPGRPGSCPPHGMACKEGKGTKRPVSNCAPDDYECMELEGKSSSGSKGSASATRSIEDCRPGDLACLESSMPPAPPRSKCRPNDLECLGQTGPSGRSFSNSQFSAPVSNQDEKCRPGDVACLESRMPPEPPAPSRPVN